MRLAGLTSRDDRHVSAIPFAWPMPWAAFPPEDDPRDVRVAFGRGIRALRLYHGLSQMELEHLSGLDQSMLARLETGRPVSVRFSRVLGLLDALAVDRTVFKTRREGATMLAFMTRGDPSPYALGPEPLPSRYSDFADLDDDWADD